MKLRFKHDLIRQFRQVILGLIGLITFVLVACSHNLWLPSAATTNLQVWAVDGLTRIGLNDTPGSNTEIKLFAARGEYEPFQIGIRANQQALNNVNVEVGNLVGPGGAIIDQSNITLYREHYVNVPNSSWTINNSTNRPLGAGWYADGLIPFVDPVTQQDLSGATLDAVPFNLGVQTNQPIWADVFVPTYAPAGDYEGTFTVTSDAGSATGTVLLHVWDFELPRKPSLNSSFSFWEPTSYASLAEFTKHRLMPATKINPVDEPNLINQWGLSSVRLPFWSGANIKTCRINEAPSVETIQNTSASHSDALLKYAYTADEINDCPGMYEPLKQWARNLHQAAVKQLVVMTPTPELYDDDSGSGQSAVDIWVVLPTQQEEAADRINTVQQKGDEVWSYTALVQDRYSPKWEIDFAPLNFRILPGFMNQSHNLTGTLYWQVDSWTNDPWNNVEVPWEDDLSQHYPGEGMLVYPGAMVGTSAIAPSMRLKWLREGVEDYEYVQILKNLGQAGQALSISREMAPDWKNWTRDPKAIASARERLAIAIENAS
ncbi:DUF4091 domain-containing protein [filamentous cyanobacterium LEGE 11480]|uniref:DUF4091 domain-containing protein n=1 Tax=Romeriopsis navalis LEGE 11480 TaxID=2777977 RepID=A0A928Z1P1_9CYAN|nr:DUF4091 domain-containing protein [Romeriopsis navalis]MBE9028699.1 DUF4091 domain-containing protein [Romeriopsis navalis LEGE 11480]